MFYSPQRWLKSLCLSVYLQGTLIESRKGLSLNGALNCYNKIYPLILIKVEIGQESCALCWEKHAVCSYTLRLKLSTYIGMNNI
jgi:hypothetical protein